LKGKSDKNLTLFSPEEKTNSVGQKTLANSFWLSFREECSAKIQKKCAALSAFIISLVPDHNFQIPFFLRFLAKKKDHTHKKTNFK